MSADNKDLLVIKCLTKANKDRKPEELKFLHDWLSQQPWSRELKNNERDDLCSRGRYEKYNTGSIIYRRGDSIDAFYVLLSGNVIIGTLLFSPPVCFGQRTYMSSRTDDCLVLDPSEMIAVDYYCPEVETRFVPQFMLSKSYSFSGNDTCYHQKDSDCLSEKNSTMHPSYMNGNLYKYDHFSKKSDSSSTFSAVTSSGIDLTGLPESAVDSDDDDDEEEEIKKSIVSDAVLEALENEVKSEADIKLILDLVQHLPAFNNQTSTIRKSLCSVMKFSHVEEANQVVIESGCEITTWAVILNGSLEVNGRILSTGDWFGATPSKEKEICKECIKTKTEGCQFLLVPKEDYCRILNEGEENISKICENGEVVLVTENRKVEGQEKEVKFIIRGEPYRLIHELFYQDEDPTYIQDFLLTYRTFFKLPSQVAYKILEYIDNPKLKEKVVTIFLDWMNWHYKDFEDNTDMRNFLEHLEKRLKDLGMHQQLDLLTTTCANLSTSRLVVLNRRSRDETLQFKISGNCDKPSSIFISHVEEGSKAQEAGLGKGDQILDVNTKSFNSITYREAFDILRSATHLSMTVKYNMSGYKLHQSQPSGKQVEKLLNKNTKMNAKNLIELEDPGKPPVFEKIKNTFTKILPKTGLGFNSSASDLVDGVKRKGHTLGTSRGRFGSSHPDLTSIQLKQNTSDFITKNGFNVLKIFKEDQSYRFIIIDKEITAKEVVMMAVVAFGLNKVSLTYALYEVTLHADNFVKQKRLSDNLKNLAERSSFRSRYYIKNVEGDSSSVLLPDECLEDFKKECHLSFLSLNCAEVAAQLTYKDFDLFSRISQSEYIEELFQLKQTNLKNKSTSNTTTTNPTSMTHDTSTSNLNHFAKQANVEMFWVVTHICNEQNLSNRVKALKRFIQVAKYCVDYKNFNSAFAIVSGLGHRSVSRLKQTWDRLSSKSLKLFEDLQMLMDPSRNMSKYRSTLNKKMPPVIPFYPLVMKDLTFIHLGNDSIIDGLVNFEKLRMIAKEVRHISKMAPSPNTINYSSLSLSTATLMKNHEAAAVLNKKKLFEEAQMVRKVREYLESYKLVEDENQLEEMSNCCESSGSTSRRLDTINFAATIYNIGLGPKFGADSPDNIRKMVSLSVASKPFEASARPTEDVKRLKINRNGITNIPQSPNSDKKQSCSDQSTANLSSSSQFYFNINSQQPNKTCQSLPTNSSKTLPIGVVLKETDSGRFSYSGDDGSTGSRNSNHGSPPVSQNVKTSTTQILTSTLYHPEAELPIFIPSTEISKISLSKQPPSECIGKCDFDSTIPYHLANDLKKKKITTATFPESLHLQRKAKKSECTENV